ncbi:MAG TPA: hypothetical protein DCQ31_13260 [Bacteroidales bacterium]|nr:hypothetical protein [Bacteroidales bacterium]
MEPNRINEGVIFEAQKMLLKYIADTAAEKGITQEQIAEFTGLKQSNVSRMLAGRYSPSLRNFLKIAQAVNCFIFIADKDSDDELATIMKERWKQNENPN